MTLSKNWINWTSKFLLLLIPFVALAGESVVKENYIDDVQFQVEEILNKIKFGEASDFDLFKLQKLEARLNELHEPFVGNHTFTSDVKDRSPVDAVLAVTNDSGPIYFYTDLRNLNGKTVVHRWISEGKVVYEQSFKVRGDRWRVWSQKTINGQADMRVAVYADNELIIIQELGITP